MKHISVVIPMYNSDKYIENTVYSIINQNYSKLQIIIIDDGSTDNSLSICKSLEQKYSYIEVYAQNNKGPGKARNKGLNYAKGDYIIFVDADDCIPQNTFKKITKILNKNSPDILIGNIKCFNDIRKWHLPYMNKIFEKNIRDVSFVENNSKINLTASVCNKWFKKSLIDNHKIKFNEEIIVGEDLLFVQACYLNSIRIILYNNDIYNYRVINRNSLIKNYSVKFFKDLIIVQRKLLSLYSQKNINIPNELLIRQIKFYIDSVFLKLDNISEYDFKTIINIGKQIVNITEKDLSEYLEYEDKRKVVFYALLKESDIIEIKDFFNFHITNNMKNKLIIIDNKFFHNLVQKYPQYQRILEIKPKVEFKIEKIENICNEIKMSGYCLISGFEQKRYDDVKKYLVITNKEQNYVVKKLLSNQLRTDVTYLNRVDKLNYDWCGFNEICIDLVNDFELVGEYELGVECLINNHLFYENLEINIAEIRNKLKTNFIGNKLVTYSYKNGKKIIINVHNVTIVKQLLLKIKMYAKDIKYDFKILKEKKLKSYLVIIIYKMFGRYIKNKKIWIMGERCDTAQDNTYCLYKYIKENYPEINVKYVIKKNCIDYHRIKNSTQTIDWGSLKHSLYMLCSTKIINSYNIRANMEPVELKEIVKYYSNWYDAKKIFLQHGVIGFSRVNHSLHKNRVNYNLFITSSEKEKKHIVEEYGYNESEVSITGLARWDKLTLDNIQKRILIMPTWRSWITSEEELYESMYFKKWFELINDNDFIEEIRKLGYKLTFYFHYQIRKLIESKGIVVNTDIDIVNNESTVQDMINSHEILITDYSSIIFDFEFLNKQFYLYNFDHDQFYSKHYNEGYINYREDYKDKIIINKQDLLEKLNIYVNKESSYNYETKKKYNNCCENIILEILRGEN